MDRWEAQYQFWNSFGVPAYEANSVPDVKNLTYPYITSEAMAGGFGSILPITASRWNESTSWATVDDITDNVHASAGVVTKVDH